MPVDDQTIPDDDRAVVLVTGASSGIGRATAVEFARQLDCHLVLAARRRDELARTARHADTARAHRSAGAAATLLVTCDLATDDGVHHLVEAVQQVGRIDVLVNNAGIGSDLPFDHPDAQRDIERMLSLNLRAPITLSRELMPLLRERRGAIVNVSSVAGLVGTPDAEVYSATKWGLTGFSEALRASASRSGVHVACVQPGPVPTPGWPHERLSSGPVTRALLTSDVETIARACVRAARRRGSVAPVRPRTYLAIPLLRAVSPWLVRRLLAGAARRDIRATLHGRRDTAAE